MAILYFIEGVILLLTGLVFAALVALFGDFGLAGVAAICGGVFVAIGIIDFLLGWGLWTLQGWARTVAIIFAIIGLLGFPIGAIISIIILPIGTIISIIGTIISIIILLYLFKPEIKAAFGQGPPVAYGPQPYMPQPPPPYQPPVQPQPPRPPTGASYCRNCGAALQPGATFCPACGTKVQ